MPFNLAEARLSTIKELQKQLKKWKKYCGKAEDRLDKQMKLNEDLQEEIKKLKEVKYPVTFQKTYKIQQEEIKKLKQFKSEVIEAMKYDDDLDDEDIIKGIRDMEEDIVGESELKEEYESYAMSHPCEMNCKHCGLTTTEDDLGISLDCGELTCEGCFEEGKSKSLKVMGNIMLIAAGKQGAAMDALEEENKKLKEKTMIYNILDNSYNGMCQNHKEWIDNNWKSIITGFAENLESMVPNEN